MSNIWMMMIKIPKAPIINFFIIPHTRAGMHILQLPWEILVIELFLNKFSAILPENTINSFQRFCACFLGTVNLRKNSFLLAGQDHLYSIHNFLSETYYLLCQRLNNYLIILGVVLKICFEENSCSTRLDKTEAVINEGLNS